MHNFDIYTCVLKNAHVLLIGPWDGRDYWSRPRAGRATWPADMMSMMNLATDSGLVSCTNEEMLLEFCRKLPKVVY